MLPGLDIPGDHVEEGMRLKPLGQGQQIRSAPSQLGLEVAPLQPHLPLGHRQAEARAAVLGRIDLRGVEAVAASDGLMVQPPQVAAHNRHRGR